MNEPIELHAYDPGWPAAFAREKARIVPLFPVPPLLVEHMGSTAIPGLDAKPVIDIIVLAERLEQARAAIPPLEATGYSFWAENPDKTKFFLAKGLPPAPRRTYHLHIYGDADEVRRHLVFRDHLRASAEARAAYLRLKAELAGRFRDDRDAYSRHKSGFIDEVVRALGGPQRSQPYDP